MILTYYNNPNDIHYFDDGTSPYDQLFLQSVVSNDDYDFSQDKLVNYPQQSDVFYSANVQATNATNALNNYNNYDQNNNQYENEQLDSFKTYKIRKGDSLSKIAVAHGMSPTQWKKLADINGLSNANLIKTGEVLYIPKEWNIVQQKKQLLLEIQIMSAF